MSLFESYTDTGTVQFSTEANAYYLVGSGQMTTGTTSYQVEDYYSASNKTFYNSYSATATMGYDFDIVALSSAACFISPQNYNGLTSAPVPRQVIIWGDQPGAAVTYWCFRKMKYLAPSGPGFVGLELYDATGAVVYSSGHPPLLVNQQYAIPSTTAGYSASLSLPSSRKYAFLNYGNTARFSAHDPLATYGNFGQFVPGVKNNNGAISFKETSTPTNFQANSAAGGILIVDVTAYG